MDDFEKNLNHVLVETFNYILKYEETSLKKVLDVPVTITETHIIEAVAKQDGNETTVSKIAALLNIAMPTATVAVKKMESKGFISKGPCKSDGRRTIVSLTETGRKIEKAHSLFHMQMVRNISKQFADAEKDVLLKVVTMLKEYFKIKVEA
ncbi:MAG: MarR family winged helix-turn-helix transcriptional regulator [Oscillospiraceae bacterium]|nr:MarR family winged helix-turn-helix transcriptional regulator [Oscillospiraceae bacterium]